jgi:hypothetical protein
LFQILIPQLHFGDFFNAIGQTRSFVDVGSMSGLPESGHDWTIYALIRDLASLSRALSRTTGLLDPDSALREIALQSIRRA